MESSSRDLAAIRERVDLRQIRDRIDLMKIVTGKLGPPAKRQGRRWLWRCPFHDDHNPSFEVDTKRGTWRCWPCNRKGDAFAFIMESERVTFREAVRIVTELAGIAIPSRQSGPEPSRPSPPTTTNKPALAPDRPPEPPSGLPPAEALALVTSARERLWTPEGTKGLIYLRGRGLSNETIKAARLGWTPGVMLPKRDGDGYWRVSGVVIPWFEGDRLAKVKIRRPEGSEPPYAEAFRDRPGLFPGPGIIQPGHPLIVAEGEFEALTLGQELRGLAAVVTLGSASNVPDTSLLVTMQAATPWYLALDADEAGDQAAAKWPARSIRVRPPEGVKDWNELHRAAPNAIRYLWGRYLPVSRPWEELAELRWGPALIEPEGPDPCPDPYALAEREAIQAEQPTPDAELAAFLRRIGHEEEARLLEAVS
jgi:DNA primase